MSVVALDIINNAGESLVGGPEPKMVHVGALLLHSFGLTLCDWLQPLKVEDGASALDPHGVLGPVYLEPLSCEHVEVEVLDQIVREISALVRDVRTYCGKQ